MDRWLTIPAWPDYEVSADGRVRSLRRVHIYRTGKPRELKPFPNNGYRAVKIHAGDETKTVKICRLILLSFVGPPLVGQECRHLNGNKLDDRVDNLAWGSRRENNLDTVRMGRSRNQFSGRTVCERGHPLIGDNLRIDAHGYRHCRACKRLYGLATREAARILRGEP